MKIKVDVDCTPEEARAFLGLPDLSPVHRLYVEKMQALINDGVTAQDFEKLMKSWTPLLEGGFDVWTRAMQQMAGGGEKK